MSFFNKLKQGVSEAGNKAKNTVETNRLKTQIKKNDEEITRLYNAIGQEVFSTYHLNQLQENENIQTYVLQIHNHLNKIKEIEKEIKTIWSMKECVCGKVVMIDSKFCPTCGHKFGVETIPFPLSNQEAPLSNHASSIDHTTSKADETPTEMLRICANCDTELENEAKFCGECGQLV